MSISTRNLAALPSASALEGTLRAYSLLDAILCPEWEFRYYSFDQNWSDHERMSSMRNGQGDHFFALFNDSGCFLKGFDQESPMSPWKQKNNEVWDGLLNGVPECFAESLTEPAFDIPNTTFCIWQKDTDEQWNRANIVFPEGEDPDGSAHMLSILDGHRDSYANWAGDYYETEIDRDAVAGILAGNAISSSLVHRLNPKQSLPLMQDDLNSIGWPIEE